MDTSTQPLASIGIDIGKEVFHIVGFSTDGKIAFRRKIKRLALIETFKRPPASIVGMEACLSAHFVCQSALDWDPRSASKGGSDAILVQLLLRAD
jgi:transposase